MLFIFHILELDNSTSVNEIAWKSDGSAENCTFTSHTVSELATASFKECAQRCQYETYINCSHWSWNKPLQICSLNKGQIDQTDAVFSNSSFCGLLDIPENELNFFQRFQRLENNWIVIVVIAVLLVWVVFINILRCIYPQRFRYCIGDKC